MAVCQGEAPEEANRKPRRLGGCSPQTAERRAPPCNSRVADDDAAAVAEKATVVNTPADEERGAYVERPDAAVQSRTHRDAAVRSNAALDGDR